MAQIKVIGKSLQDGPVINRFRGRNAASFMLRDYWFEPMSPGPFEFVDLADSVTLIDSTDAVSVTELQDSVVIIR